VYEFILKFGLLVCWCGYVLDWIVWM